MIAKITLEKNKNIRLGNELMPGMLVKYLSNNVILITFDTRCCPINLSDNSHNKNVGGIDSKGQVYYIKLQQDYLILADSISFNVENKE